jgi:hypothetical protein
MKNMDFQKMKFPRQQRGDSTDSTSPIDNARKFFLEVYKQRILTDVLNAAESRYYSGYSKFDALNSPVPRKFFIDNKRLRLLQIMKNGLSRGYHPTHAKWEQ